MKNTIIDNVNDLMKLSRDELDEVLLDSKYNKAMLRELIRRCIWTAKDYKNSLNLYMDIEETNNEKIIKFKKDIKKAFEELND